MTLHHNHIGIDVSKAHLDVFCPRTASVRRVANRPADLAAFVAGLPKDAIVVLEATGIYDRMLCDRLAVAGIGYGRVNPLRARHFARAIGQIAKTDRLDARMLSRMGEALALVPDPVAQGPRRALAGLTRRRDQLVALRAREANHAETADPQGAVSIARHIQWLDGEIADLEGRIAALIADDDSLGKDNALPRSAPGIGPVAATTLLALLPELGTRSDKAIAALCGLAPLNRDSGIWRGKRSIGPGRKRVRMALYMAALNAARCNPRFKAAYQALRDRGKPAKLALIAIARKLVITLNAMIKNQAAFRT